MRKMVEEKETKLLSIAFLVIGILTLISGILWFLSLFFDEFGGI